MNRVWRSVFVVIVLVASGSVLTGCGGDASSNEEKVYIKKERAIQVTSEPSSYRDHALVSNGDVIVKTSLTTDGPLADVHANGKISARALSLDISGKVTASNDPAGSVIRSFDYVGTKERQDYITVRALKVSEHLNTAVLDEYYRLKEDGNATYVYAGTTEAMEVDGLELLFEEGQWRITGGIGKLSLPLIVETSLTIETEELLIGGTLMVQGELKASGELNVNTGTPFGEALIIDKNTEVDKLITVGRVFGSGDFLARGEVNIIGNVEIDGDVSLYGNAKINFLDNVYKSALYEAQEDAADANTTMMLVHSQLFADLQGKNSVMLFTFVEGDYLLNETTLFGLLENGDTDAFTFHSYLYGATIDYGAQLMKFEGLSPYYENKHALINSLKTQGHETVKISESLDLLPSNLYHTFEDGNGNILGTYKVFSLSAPTDPSTPELLTQTQREEALESFVRKEEIEQEELTAMASQVQEEVDLITANSELNDSIRAEALAAIAAIEAESALVNPEAALDEAEEQRIAEWVTYQELADQDQELYAEKIELPEEGETRSWLSKAVKSVKKAFKKVTFTDCKQKTDSDSITHVEKTTAWKNFRNDVWTRKIAINNNGNQYCTPISASMILNYHNIRKGKSPLYSTNLSDNTRRYASTTNSYVERIAGGLHTSKSSGTSAWRLYNTLPVILTAELWRNHHFGYAWSFPTPFATRPALHNNIKSYIKHDNPVIYSTWGKVGRVEGQNIQNHSMPVIGYKRKYYSGSCWKKILPENKWILVDTTWMQQKTDGRPGYKGNSRAYIRFDSLTNYFTVGTVTFLRAY